MKTRPVQSADRPARLEPCCQCCRFLAPFYVGPAGLCFECHLENKAPGHHHRDDDLLRSKTVPDRDAERKYDLAMRSLSEGQRRLLRIYFDELLTQSEIAKRLGRSQQAVADRLKRIRLHFRRHGVMLERHPREHLAE